MCSSAGSVKCSTIWPGLGLSWDSLCPSPAELQSSGCCPMVPQSLGPTVSEQHRYTCLTSHKPTHPTPKHIKIVHFHLSEHTSKEPRKVTELLYLCGLLSSDSESIMVWCFNVICLFCLLHLPLSCFTLNGIFSQMHCGNTSVNIHTHHALASRTMQHI